jgi:predicted ATPase
MLIKVVKWNRGKIRTEDSRIDFYLEQNNWNDYNFYTTYALYLAAKHTKDGQPALISSVKILKKGQQELEKYLLGEEPFNELGEEFCSMGINLDYYERIAQLEKPLAEQILKAMRDFIIYPEFKSGFEDEPGLKVSLMRDISSKDDLFLLAPMLVNNDFNTLLSLELKFTFHSTGLKQPIEFDFDAPTYGEFKGTSLPNRIIAIIGRNGSGKSTLLAKLARVAFASSRDRVDDVLQQVGVITPIGIGFPRILTIAYSAFDSFKVPGIHYKEKEQIAKDIDNATGRYIFCGVRNIVKELSEELRTMDLLQQKKLPDKSILSDRQENTILKHNTELADEFVQLIAIINIENRHPLYNGVMTILKEEPSLHILKSFNLIESPATEVKQFFINLSTGHKFVLHCMISMVTHIEAKSLVLFDEPETHLHPPLLAILMKAIRWILNQRNSFMIVATHSPVVLQETLRKHVLVIRREEDVIEMKTPDIQTFGENIGAITTAVFALSTDVTDYHDVLDKMIAGYGLFIRTPEEIMAAIEKVFQEDLSMQARAYLRSKLFTKS